MYGGIEWNYNKIEVDITWRTQTREHLIFYITMPISCDINLKSMIGLATKYGLRYVELYLNSIPKWVYSSFSIEYIKVSSYTQILTQASQSIDPSKIVSGVMNLISIPKIRQRKDLIIYGCVYVNNNFEPSDKKDEGNGNLGLVDLFEEDEPGEPISQFMGPPILKFGTLIGLMKLYVMVRLWVVGIQAYILI